jgi:hypothetical protein
MIMWLQEVYQRLVNRPQTRRQTCPQTGRRHRTRLGAERLGDRQVLSNFTAATVSHLIADVNAANGHGATKTTTLAAPATSPIAGGGAGFLHAKAGLAEGSGLFIGPALRLRRVLS